MNKPCFLSDYHNIVCIVTRLQCPPRVPKCITCRSYKNFHEDIYLNDLNNAPFMICNVFDDPDDKAWCFTKLLSDVMVKNAPSKNKIFKKPSVPFMNSNLRKAMHKRNMRRNKYRKGLVVWEVCRRQRNLTTAIYERSKLTYFRERCEGGVKNQ